MRKRRKLTHAPASAADADRTVEVDGDGAERGDVGPLRVGQAVGGSSSRDQRDLGEAPAVTRREAPAVAGADTGAGAGGKRETTAKSSKRKAYSCKPIHQAPPKLSNPAYHLAILLELLKTAPEKESVPGGKADFSELVLILGRYTL